MQSQAGQKRLLQPCRPPWAPRPGAEGAPARANANKKAGPNPGRSAGTGPIHVLRPQNQEHSWGFARARAQQICVTLWHACSLIFALGVSPPRVKNVPPVKEGLNFLGRQVQNLLQPHASRRGGRCSGSAARSEVDEAQTAKNAPLGGGPDPMDAFATLLL